MKDETLKYLHDIREAVLAIIQFVEGKTFETYTTAEMLQDPATEIFDVIRYFGQRKKIFNIHFRNIRGKRNDFQEVYPDEGDMDMFQVALALKEVGYRYMLMPDHIPSHPDDPETLQGFAYAYGYIKGIIQAVSALS